MPNDYSETPDSLLLIVDGIDSVLRWDGLYPTAETAGVIGPTEAITLAASGVGQIVGSLYGYARFVDRLGNYSNLSPIGTPVNINSQSGPVQGVSVASNTSGPVQINSTGHGLVTGQTVYISGVLGTNSPNGTWPITVVDANNFTLNGSVTDGGTYAGGGTWYAGAATITYSNLPTPTEPKVTRRQILRNTAGQALTFFVDIDTTDLTSSSLSSTNIDTQLVVAVPLFDPNTGADLAIARYTPPPNDRKAISNHNGRMFYAAVEDYKQGGVAVTFGSTTVTGIGTEWPATLANRALYVNGAASFYIINSVDVVNQTLTLATAYTDPTNPYAVYSITPVPGAQRLIYFSESLLPQAVSPENALSLAEDGDVITGLLRMGPFLYFLEKTKIYNFSFQLNPGLDGLTFKRADRGCINQRCWVIVEQAMYMLDQKGIHVFYGNDSDAIATPIQDLFDVNTSLPFKINWNQSRFFHAVLDPGDEAIRWFVALNGEFYPRFAIAYGIRTKAFWLEEYCVPITSSCLATINNRYQVFLGSTCGRILAAGTQALDGCDPANGSTVGTVTSATQTTLTDTSSSYGSDVVNCPVWIYAGTGKGQFRVIVSVNSQTLNLDQPWLTMPDTTSQYQIGGISWNWLSAVYRLARVPTQNERRFETIFSPTIDPLTMDQRIYFDRSETPANWGLSVASSAGSGVATTKGDFDAVGDLTKTRGFFSIRFDSLREGNLEGNRFMQVEVGGVKGRDPLTVYQITIDGVEPNAPSSAPGQR